MKDQIRQIVINCDKCVKGFFVNNFERKGDVKIEAILNLFELSYHLEEKILNLGMSDGKEVSVLSDNMKRKQSFIDNLKKAVLVCLHIEKLFISVGGSKKV